MNNPSFKGLNIRIPINVGPPFAYGPPIMSLGAGLFRIRAMIGRSPIMSFDFGGLKM